MNAKEISKITLKQTQDIFKNISCKYYIQRNEEKKYMNDEVIIKILL